MTYQVDALHLDISALLATAQKQLLESTPVPIVYHDTAVLKNNQLPLSLKKSPINVYALWMRANSDEAWTLMYIGQRSRKYGWSRVAQHLFATPSGTQSKLQQVRAAIEAGAQIGVTGILIEPDSLRLSVEEELIQRNSSSDKHLLWNQKARANAQQRRQVTNT
ncbi:hypothetical protein [Comamonas testosteroni]|uniref:hypothetical protein n=1 Tax=Comamonas testosteroni TaxID=285 RepID=UPI002DB82C0F|nr:hypothetical protein [Comamonas testosteroni]MEB5964492.1 hypothetical protein [Comamonas testosteroni]